MEYDVEKIVIDGVEVNLKQYAKAEEVSQIQERIVDLIEQNVLTQYIVDSVDDMTDITKKYVLKSTGKVWEYQNTTTEQEVTEEVVFKSDNPFTDNARLSSSGVPSSDVNGYVVTPLIDLTEYANGETIQLHFNGLNFITESEVTYHQVCIFDLNKTLIGQRYSSMISTYGYFTNVKAERHSNTSSTLTIKIPPSYLNSQIGYMRLGAQGTSTDVTISVTRIKTITGGQWVDTGLDFGYIVGGESIDKETLDKLLALNNEGSDAMIIKLLAKPVLDFYNASAYSNDDYTTSHLSNKTYPCRADVPVPFTVKWNHNENAMRTTVSVDTKAIGENNFYTLKTYDATGFDNFPLYNLLPNTTYYYKVTHILSNGSLVEAKSGSFATSSETVRLLYIEGTQNVRDLGGWSGLNGKKVRYGKIIRGASLNESVARNLIVTGKGRLALAELNVQAELNLGAVDNETSIASNCEYRKIYYANYATAIAEDTYRIHFKTALEWIVDCLTNSKPVYMHCQGGCDRTGTLSFQLLGLLGVSESNLAKEYELSSFSDVGLGRLRTTTKAVDTYDYVGMVQAIKAYSGSTITEKFYNFAIACGVSADTITSFRNLMLE